MANVKALCVRGIRSFGPDDGDQQYISFSRPLTLILGQNGCGKTTIIECLRYAVTGQQPPGSRNECFVYDAKVNKTREVMGQVKLKIVNAAGHELTVTRSMQVTSKEKRTQFKTLDGSIERIDDKGVRREISSRCADIDHIMQEELGVSKAIINSVIFCHQEDSSWPLEEGKKVKERFDEIFDADKYSDCFERLKKIRKEYGGKIKLIEQKVDHLTEKKSELDRKKIELVNMEKRIEDAELKMAAISADIKPVVEKIKAIEVIQRNLVEFENNKNRANTRLEHCLTQQKELKKTIKKIFEGSDEELNSSIDSYESLAQSKQRSLSGLQQNVERLGAESERITRETGDNEVKFNRLLLLESQHQDRIGQRSNIIMDAAKEADVTVPEDLETSSQAAHALSILEQAFRTKQTQFEETRARADAEEKTLQRSVDDAREALARHKQKTESKKSEQDGMKREMVEKKRHLADADRSKAKLDNLQVQLEKAEKEYDSIAKEMDCDKCQSEINEQEMIRDKLDLEEGVLNDTIARLQTKSNKLAEKKALEESLASKEKALAVLKNKHRSSLQELLQRMPERCFALAVSEVECTMRTEVDSMNKQIKEKQNLVTKLQSERTHVHELMKEAQAELAAGEDKLYQACGGLEYKVALAKVDAAVDKLRDEQNTLQSSVFIINKYKNQLKDSGSCPLCNRGFDSQSEVVQLISELTTKVINVPATLERVSEQLSRQAAKRDELVQLGSVGEKMVVLKNSTIPQLEKRRADLDKQLQQVNEALEELSMSVAEPERRLMTAGLLVGDMPLLDRYTHEIEAAQRDVRALAEECATNANDPTPEEAAARQKDLRHKISLLRTGIKSKQTTLNTHTKKLQVSMLSKNRLKEELLEVQKKTQDAVSLRAALDKLMSDVELAELELRTLQEEAPRLRAELQEKHLARDSHVENQRKALDTGRSKLSRLDSLLEQIRSLARDIQRHEDKHVDREMATLKQSNKTLAERKSKIQEEREELAKKMDMIKDELAKQEIYKRDLEDNVKLRACAMEAAACEREIASIVAAAGGLDTAALAQKETLIRKQTSMFSERAQTEGQLAELQRAVSSSKTELGRANNRNLEEDYRRELYELNVLRALDKDIKDYSAAMDKCLMQFHKEKMESINLIIREMWRKIYRGNDIDYIEIKTGNTEATGDRRKYEYRVVQCKNGVEIDMRGRCSAGQKVLACLIIRLALAETFSTRFGVLALDEPTTNLDQDNIKSLCQALGNMVLERAAQRNFMFILITHDKDFIESLGNIDKVTHYYEVSRNDDGKSRIKKIKFS